MLSPPLEGGGGQGQPLGLTEHEGGDPQGSDLMWRGEREKTQLGGLAQNNLRENYSPFPASLGLIHAHASSQWWMGGRGRYTMSKPGGRGPEGPEPRSAEDSGARSPPSGSETCSGRPLCLNVHPKTVSSSTALFLIRK